jgi:hypothetical protein
MFRELIATAVLAWCLNAVETSPASASSNNDLALMANYATIIGRGVACGEDIKPAMAAVARWMQRVFTVSEQSRYLLVFVGGIEKYADEQKAGISADSCDEVTRNFRSFPWP